MIFNLYKLHFSKSILQAFLLKRKPKIKEVGLRKELKERVWHGYLNLVVKS